MVIGICEDEFLENILYYNIFSKYFINNIFENMCLIDIENNIILYN